MDSVDRLAEFLQSARRGVAFTGAGMSTESGIADFRSPGGVWSRHSPVYYDEFLASREARIRYWKMHIELHDEFAGARPNDGHRALAVLEQLKKVVAVITQTHLLQCSDRPTPVVAQKRGFSGQISDECGKRSARK